MFKTINKYEYKLYRKDEPCICNNKNADHEQVMICSISKIFGYIMILILQEKGLLKITDTLDKHGIKFNGSNKIRIYDLLEHKTNIPSKEIYENIMNKHKKSDDPYFTSEWTKEDIILELNKYHNHKTDKFEYCSIGFSIIGMIIENVTGKTVPVCVKRYILDPLNLKHTEFQHDTKPEDYEFNYPEFDIAGNMMSTIDDMYIFLTSELINYIPTDSWYYDNGFLKLDGYNPGKRGIFFLCIKCKNFNFVGYFRPCPQNYTYKIVDDVIETIDFLTDNKIKPFIIPDYFIEHVKNDFSKDYESSFYATNDIYRKYKKNRIYCHSELKLIKINCVIDLKDPDDDPDWNKMSESSRNSIEKYMNGTGIQKIYLKQVFFT